MSPHESRLALVGGKVYSKGLSTSRRADVLIGEGRIKALLAGVEGNSRAVSDGGYRPIDVTGKLVLPGFHDAHLHPTTAALAMTRDCWLPAQFDGPAYLAALKRYAGLNADALWITGRGWRAGPIRAGGLDRHSLDTIIPDRPVHVLSLDFHSAWVNSRALEIAGIDRSTPDPVNGVIERDAEGFPNGFLHESAKSLVNHLLPRPGTEDLKGAILWAQEYLFALGVTSWQDAWVDDAVLKAYVELAREERLVARVVAALGWDAGAGIEQVEGFLEKRKAADFGRLSAPIVKIMNDGVCEVGTAALHEPYHGLGSPGREDRGLAFNQREQLREIVAALTAAGFAMHFHCVGDRSVSDCVDVCECAPSAVSGQRPPHQIAHLQLVSDADMARMAKIGIVANVQPASLCADLATSKLLHDLLGSERYAAQYPLSRLRDAGVHIACSSDWAVTTADPLVQIRAACGDSAGDWMRMNPENCLGINEAVDAYTWGAAFASGLESVRGQLIPGAVADIVVLEQDILRRWDGSGSVAATIVEGRVVYSRPGFL